MPIPVSNIPAQERWKDFKLVLRSFRRRLVSYRNKFNSSGSDGFELEKFFDDLIAMKTLINNARGTQNIETAARNFESRGSDWNVVSELNTLHTRINNTIRWFVNNFPADENDFAITYRFTSDGRVARSFSSAQLSTLVTIIGLLINELT